MGRKPPASLSNTCSIHTYRPRSNRAHYTEGNTLLTTRIVQMVLIVGVLWSCSLAIRILIQDVRDSRAERLGRIPIDYSGEIRRKS